LLLTVLLLVLGFASAAPAVVQGRTDYFFHVHVDPIYGDDAQALLRNPGPGGTGMPLQEHPDINTTVTPPVRPLRGRLNHAPAAFRTVSAAPAYIAVAFGPLPATFGGLTVEKVIIHCLPGMYGPVLGTPIDGASGLPWNGEAFPLVVPHGVSIRGAAALDVIFDAREQLLMIFDIPTTPLATPFNHTQDFINGVTIRNARSLELSPFGFGAGIFIHGPAQNQRTVSNLQTFSTVITSETPADLMARGGRPRAHADPQRAIEMSSLREAVELRRRRRQ
jgi:hypothetical protein